MASAAQLVAQATEMLDEESHRYVERFVDCRNGCRYEYQGINGALVQVAGPPDCDVCSIGQEEDENAEHLNPFIDALRELAGRLESAAKELADLDLDGWPGHLTCSEAETLARVLGVIDPERAGDLLASHAESDDEDDVDHHVEGREPAPA